MKTRYYIITFIALFLCNMAVSAQERNPNRMVFHKGDKVLKTYSVDELDDITFDYVENKEVGITVKETTENSCKVSFTMPDNCSYYYVAAVTAEHSDLTQYVQAHYAAKLTKSKEYEFTNLRSGIDYYILALPIDKYGLSTVLSKKNIKTISSQYENRASTFFDVDYWADTYMNGYQNFVIRMGDCLHLGVYPKGNGRIYNFSIYCKTADGTDEPMPQPGTYTYYKGDKPIDMCMEYSESLMLEYSNYEYSKDTYDSKTIKYDDASLTIEKNTDGTYTVKALIKQENGELVELTYTGEVTYRDKSFKGYTGPNLNKDITFTCDYLVPYDLDGVCFEIMDGGDPSAEGASWYKRNRVTIFLADDGKGLPRLGTFKVTKDGANGTVQEGYYKNYGGGVSGSFGTRYEYNEVPTQMATFGFVNGGSVTISKNSTTGDYTIATDFITDKGRSIKATYTGPFKSNRASSMLKKRNLRIAPAVAK